ncbi:MAG TPA: ferritin [Nocardioidaceae bacterium]|jgi:ferritin
MASQKFVEQLNAQIGHEFSAHQQYVACAVYFDAKTMPRMAAFFYRQALEERDHAMMMVQYLIDANADVEIPGAESPTNTFENIVAPVRLALDQENRVATQINDLTALARAENDYASDQFMQWFIKEQVEEVATMSDLLTVVIRAEHDVEAIEEYVARELGDVGDDSTAPAVAGS